MSRTAIGFLLLACLLASVRAQSVEFAVQRRAQGAASIEVAFREIESSSGSVGLRLSAGSELELGLELREAGSLATVGNIVTSLAAHGSTDGRYGLRVSSRAALGPAALRVRGSVSDGNWSDLTGGGAPFPVLPLLGPGPAILGGEIGVTYRASRRLVLDFEPGVFVRGNSWGGRFSGELRLLRAFSGNDVAVLLHAFVEPGGRAASGAAGVRYTLNRQRAPSWSGAVLLGAGPAGLLPGARLIGSERLATGRLDLALHLEPYRLDSWPYRIVIDYQHQIGEGDLLVGLRTGLEPSEGWRLGGRVGYRLAFPR